MARVRASRFTTFPRPAVSCDSSDGGRSSGAARAALPGHHRVHAAVAALSLIDCLPHPGPRGLASFPSAWAVVWWQHPGRRCMRPATRWQLRAIRMLPTERGGLRGVHGCRRLGANASGGGGGGGGGGGAPQLFVRMQAGEPLDRAAIYRGEVLVYRGLRPMFELCKLGGYCARPPMLPALRTAAAIWPRSFPCGCTE